MNITPGVSTAALGRQTLEGIGAQYDGLCSSKDSDLMRDLYVINLGDPSADSDAPPSVQSLMYALVCVSSSNGVVQAVDVSAVSSRQPGASGRFRADWSRYSASQIFTQLGPPDEAYVGGIRGSGGSGGGEELIMIYRLQGIYVRLHGGPDDINICPEQPAADIRLQMTLFDPREPVRIAEFNDLLDDPSAWQPVQQALGVTPHQFYEKVIAEPGMCFPR